MRNYNLEFMQINDNADAKEFVSDCNGLYHLKVNLQTNGKITKENLETLQTFVKNKTQIEKNVKEISLHVPYEKIPKEIFNILVKFQNQFPNIQMFIGVYHQFKSQNDEHTEFKEWDFDAVLKANNAIDKVCDKIKKCHLSPCEALAYIHKFVSTVAKYNSSKNRYWNSDDQHFVGAFTKNKEFVCAGFSSLEKEIIDTLNMPGLKCEIVSVDVYNRDKDVEESHSRCMIFVDDKTYNIKRTVFDDPTWDNDDKVKTPKYTHFMMPKITHEDDVSYKYDYRNLSQITNENKNLKEYKYIYPKIDYSSKDVYPLSQEIVEKIHFNMLSKTSNLSFDEIYNSLKEMAKQSYIEQTERKFKGSLKSENVCLTKQKAKKIYSKNNAELEK